MSDFKSLFKAAKAQREGAAPAKLSKEQIRALKAQKAAAAAKEAEEAARRRAKEEAARAAAAAAPPQQAASAAAWPAAPRTASRPVPPPPKFAGPAATAAAGSAAATASSFRSDSRVTRAIAGDGSESQLRSTASFRGAQEPAAASSMEAEGSTAAGMQSSLPDGFFEAPDADDAGVNNEQPQESVVQPRGNSKPAAGQTDGPGAIPRGFFENKEADAKARGEAPKKKRSKEEEFSDFLSAIAVDVKVVEAREEEEAAEAAAERAERELFEQSMRMQRVEKLKAAKAGTGPSTSSQQDDELAAEVALDPDIIPVGPAKKRRMLNLSEVLEPSLDAEGEDDEEDDDLVLDWRAKTF